jgi:16S rRNA (cytidine1402-2'-O)-methyltransferase
MPSNLHTSRPDKTGAAGSLYIVATPIGNKDDITLRALKVLGEVDLVATEDTRKTGRFLKIHNLKCRLISYHEHNEKRRTPELLRKLAAGTSIALVSNAGTPSVSDPGYRLITAAVDEGIAVIPIPGVSAATAAISVSGLETDAFVFIGFPSKKKGKRLNQLTELANEIHTIIFYESPKRILKLIEEIIAIMGDRRGVLAREMTKRHEEYLRGNLSAILENLISRTEVKGECTLLVAGRAHEQNKNLEAVITAIEDALAADNRKLSDLAREIAREYDLTKKEVYAQALKIREKNN